MKVMIVDDDATTLHVVAAVLVGRGYDVIERDTAIGTTLAILREKPDVVLLDVRMPGLTGDKLASLIGQRESVRPIVILHSSMPESALEKLAHSSGASGFVSKGDPPMVFLARFEEVLGAAQRGIARRRAGR